MSILAQRPDTLTAFRQARAQFWGYLAGGLGLAAIVWLMPKGIIWPLARLLLVCCFFAGLVAAIWALGEPLAVFLHARTEMALEDAGAEIRAISHEYIDLLNQALRNSLNLALAGVVLIFLRVLAEWPLGAPLAPFKDLFRYGAWGSGLLALLWLILKSSRWLEAAVLGRTCERQLQLSGFRAISETEVETRASRLLGPPVVITGRYSFQAGGIDWSWSDFQKNAILFGQTGSGKTITVLNGFLDGLLSSANGQEGAERAAALILDPKGDYLAKIERLCLRLGRRDDLLVIDPNKPEDSIRYNPFDGADDALEISERFAGVLQLLGMKNTQDTFFIESAKNFIQHAIGLLRATEPPDVPPSFASIDILATQPIALEARLFVLNAKALLSDLQQASDPHPIVELARSDAVLRGLIEQTSGTEPWASFFRRWRGKPGQEKDSIYAEIKALAPTLSARPPISLSKGSEAALAAEYMANTWLGMPDRTRGSVQAQLTTMLNPFLVEPYRSLFSGRSTVNMGDVLDQGRILYVFMPRDDRTAMSRMINTLIKLDYYRQVLLRRKKTRPSLFFCDEFQAFFSSEEGRGDAPFFERSRESFHANVVATQNLSAILRDVPKEETVHNFLGNCAIKLFLRNTEGKTNEFAAKDVFGEYMGQVVNLGHSVSGRVGRQGMNEGSNVGKTLQRLPRVPPERFTQLAIPDQTSGADYAEAMVHLGSRASVEIHRLRFKVHPLID